MKKTEIEKLKDILINNIKELSNSEFDVFVDVDGDESDQVQGDFIMSMAYDKNDRIRSRLNKMIEALDKIKLGEYGNCEECECEIGYKRLCVCPETKYCIGCAENLEKESRLSFKK